MSSSNRDNDSPLAFLDRERILLLLFGLVLFLPGLGRHDLWNPDEPRSAEVAREMLDTGSYLVPHLNGELYSDEPPLHFWTISSMGLLRGQLDEATVRLPSALAAIASSLLVFSLGLRLFSTRVAWIAALVFMTSYKVLWQGRTGQVGMLLTFWITLGIYFWVRGTLEDRPGLTLLFFVALGLGTLTRGLEALLPPVLTICVFLLMTGQVKHLRRLMLGPGPLIWLIVTLAWLVPAIATVGLSNLGDLLITEPFQPLFASGSSSHLVGHFKPWYYYLTTIPVDFLPWSFLFPATAWIAWRRARGEARQWVVFLLAWVAVTLILFSLSPVKRSVNVLTMFPALALLVGFGLDRAQDAWPRFRSAIAIPALLASLLIAAAGISVPLLQSRPELADLDPDLGRAIASILVLGALGVLLGSRWLWLGQVRAAVRSTAIGMGILILGAALIVAPRLDTFKSARPLAAQVLEHLGPGQALGMYPRLEPGVLFYTHRLAHLAETEEELLRLLREDSSLLLVARRRSLNDLERPLPLVEIYRDHALRDGWSLLGPAGELPAEPGGEEPSRPAVDQESHG